MLAILQMLGLHKNCVLLAWPEKVSIFSTILEEVNKKVNLRTFDGAS
jgi:hypothetical protein